MNRRRIFISHAHPEEDAFGRWLASRLLLAGYEVWIDLIELKGGEFLWPTIEEAIREQTACFLFVLSNSSASPTRRCKDELELALQLEKAQDSSNFVIPLELEKVDVPIELSRRTRISFCGGWWDGFRVLREKLERLSIPTTTAGRDSSQSFDMLVDYETQLSNQTEMYYTNWFPIQSYPSKIYLHTGTSPDVSPAWPSVWIEGHGFLTFSAALERTPSDVLISTTEPPMMFDMDQFLSGETGHVAFQSPQCRHYIAHLFVKALIGMGVSRGMGRRELSNKNQCIYFPKGLADRNKVRIRAPQKARWSNRNVVGNRYDRYWHFGVSAVTRFFPYKVIVLKPHVLFSDDGINIWEDTKKLHKARRKECSTWWNDAWRDRIAAFMAWLSSNGESLGVEVSSTEKIFVDVKPLDLVGSVGYTPGREKCNEDFDIH